MCVCVLFSGMVRMDTWVARDVWMGVPMRVLCGCAVRVCGSACDGAAPATVRDVDQALAVAATIRTTACTCASSLHCDMHILTCAYACHVLEVMGLHLSRSAMRIRLSPSLLSASVLAMRFV